MSISKLPFCVIDKIDKTRAFFWKGTAFVSAYLCVVDWTIINEAKLKGGLQIKNLEDMNMTLLTVWGILP